MKLATILNLLCLTLITNFNLYSNDADNKKRDEPAYVKTFEELAAKIIKQETENIDDSQFSPGDHAMQLAINQQIRCICLKFIHLKEQINRKEKLFKAGIEIRELKMQAEKNCPTLVPEIDQFIEENKDI